MELKLPAPCLVVLVGASGAGKSTWAAEHFAGAEIVSSDALRAMVGAGEDDQTASTPAFDILEQIVTERMGRGLTTVIDTLGFDSKARHRWVAAAHDAGMTAHAIVFDTEPSVCEQRNDARARSIPKTALRRQLARFRAVREELATEAFDGVHTEQPVAVVVPGIVAAERATKKDHQAHTFGLLVSSFDWDEDLGVTLAEIARRAERAGFRDIWVMDHFRQIRGVGRPWEDLPEAYTSLGYMAGVTSQIRLGALVTAITHRPPIVLGQMIAALDVLSGGRANCGLGIGWDAEEHAMVGIDLPPQATRYEMLEETLEMLPLLWGKGAPEFHGAHIDSTALTCYPRPVQEHIPVLIGGSGELRTLALVARFADACNVFGDPERVRQKVEVLHQHCSRVDRDPGEIEVTHLSNALVAPDRETLRAKVEGLRDRNTTPERFLATVNGGTVDDLVALFRAYAAAGARHSIVSMPDVS
ncbi:MAG: LLM class flavin-dependent oxidoreductase, partial [Acidimicrobiia bacterium]